MGGRLKRRVVEVECQFLAYLIDSKKIDALIVGYPCGVDVIDSKGLIEKLSYGIGNAGVTITSLAEPEIRGYLNRYCPL